ncbi:MAG: T9SS type A sorting domain-containing protein, partial [Bacteroidales bacterium]|nr:T9SS type A sorting domain-containing protein [Bacteroidales bacterium]
MKAKTFILSFLMMFCSVAFGQTQSHWGQVSNHFDEEMVVITQIMIDNDLQGSNIELGAFCGNELRGSAFPDATDNNIVYIMVKGNKDGDKITFKLYDHNLGKELDYVKENALTFEADARVGSISGIQNGLLKEEYRTVFTSVASTNDVKYGTLQGAINACTTGYNTVTLLANISDDVTVKQVEGVNIIINGDNNEYSGTFYIHGNARSNGAETLTFKNVNFTTSEASHYFIDSNETTSAERYAHNVTVEGCNFTATGDAKNTAVAMRIRQGFNIAIDGGTFTDLHSALQAYGNDGITVTGITLKGKNGISAGTSNDVVIKNSNITATGYGVRADGTAASVMTVANNTINANIPVIVRKTNTDYILNVDNCNLTAVAGGVNTKEYQVVLTSGDDEAKFAIPTSKATATITGDVKTYGLEAKAGDVCYARFEDALEAAKTYGSDITILQYVLRDTEVTYDLGADKGVQITTGKYVSTTAFLFDANATVKNADFHSENVYAFFVDSGAKLVIEDGKYHAATTVAQVTKGSLEILGGEFSVEPYQGSYAYLINCKDNNYPNNATVTVKGGKFHKWNPENNAAEGAGTNFCAEGFTSVALGNNVYEVTGAVAKIGETLYATFDAAYTAATKGDVIELLQTAVITNSKPWINYSKKQITVKANLGTTAFRVQDGAYVWFGGMTIESNDYCIIVGASDGSSGANVEIYGGTYNGETSAISVTKGDVKIMDGTFKVEPYQGSYEYTINCVDANYKNGADVSIQGGKFYNFNPMNNAAEGTGTNFVINDYATAKDADNYWHVGKVIAKIGETPYLSLTDAVEAVQNGETITLAYRENSYNGNGIVINKSITIDFNGKTYSVNKAVGSTGTESNGFQILAGNTVTLKNGTLNVASNSGSQFYILVQNYANLTVEGMNLDGTLLDKYSKTDGDSYVLSNNSGNVNIINTTIKANNDGNLAFAFDVCDSKDYTVKPVVYVKGNNTKVEGKIEVAETLKDNLHIQGGTYDFDVEEEGYCDNAYFTKDNGNGTWTVEGPYVAQIGETRYATLAAAISAATSGETIEIIADVTEDATISKNVTINGAGKTYTGKMTLTNKADIKIKNVNFDGKGYNGYAVETRGAYYVTIEDCTAKNYGYGFVQLVSSTVLTTVKNVTVSDMNYGVKVDYSSKVVLENADIDVKIAAVYNSNYGEKTINVKNSTITSINVWERDGYSAVQTFNFEGTNTVGSLDNSQCAKYVITAKDATITAPQGSNVTTTVDKCVVKWEDVDEDGVGVYSVKDAIAAIGNEYFASIQDAINAAEDGNTIVVLRNINLNETALGLLDNAYSTYFKVEGKIVTIDLNGKTISGEFNSTPMLVGLFSTENNGHLTLVDNSDEDKALVDLKSGNDQVYALIVNYEPGCSITIDGGTYKLDKAKDAIVYTGASLNEGGVTIEDGIFELGNVGTGTNGQPWIFNVKGQNFRGVQVNGGTFNSDINHQFWANEVYVPETLALRNNGNGTWTVYEAEAYVVETASSTGASPRKVGYETLTEALAVAMDKNYTTVGLSNDITTDKVYTIKAGETVTFDLNGKTLQGTDNTSKNFGLIQNNGTLTVNATNGGSMLLTATVNSGWNRYSAVISNNPGATLTVNGGTIEHLGGTDMAYGIDALTNGGIGDVNTTIIGGTIKSTYRAVRQFLNSDSKENNLTVNGGTLEGANKSIFFHDPSTKANNGTVTVSANAVLKGDVYLYVTAGSTEWPVEVSIANAAFQNGSTVITGNVPESYAVDQVDAIWTVLRVSTQDLVSGWNWFSHYVEGDILDQLKDQLSENGISIKTTGAFINNQGGLWVGNLSTTSVEKMYKINVQAQTPINVSGKIVDPSEHPITLGTNWNWIGYPMNVSMSLNEAYANVANDGDFIKTNGAFAEYSADDQSWHGNLRSLTPGVGYMYFNAEVNTTDVFTYSYSQSRSSVEANITAENNYWSVEAAQYANNMTMVATLDVNSANYEVAAFVNGEVRGSARPIYVESLDAYMFFLTIHGDDVEEVTFKCYDIDTDTEYALNNVINYSNDAILGSLKNPYTLSRGTVGLEELSSNFNIYPNPTTTDREINLTTTCDKVEVFNALGVKVAEYQNVDTLDAFETAGIYVIRVTNNGNVKHCRLVV